LKEQVVVACFFCEEKDMNLELILAKQAKLLGKVSNV
jgi:hypothetical protein